MNQRLRVMVVEDEPLIALDIEAELTDRGFDIAGPFGSVADALACVAGDDVSIAILDISLGRGGNSFDIARALAAKHIPFIFLSGDAQKRPEEFKTRTVLTKPIDYAQLDRSLKAAAG